MQGVLNDVTKRVPRGSLFGKNSKFWDANNYSEMLRFSTNFFYNISSFLFVNENKKIA